MSICLGLRVQSHFYTQRPKTEWGSKSLHFGLEIRFIVACEVARDFRKGRVRRIGVDVIRAERSEDDIHSTLRALQSRNRQPKRWLGQHYMVNEQVNSAMVQLVGIQPGDLILEIGPGTGSLTKFLVEAGAHIIAVEKDQDMAALVAERFAHTDQVEVVHEDFVKWSVSSQINEALEQRYRASTTLKRAKVIANLPFNITTQVVKKLLPLGNTFSHVVLLLQDEAAIRLVDASPDCNEYRPISLLVNFFSVPEYRFSVGRDSFFPQPRVDAGVVSFALKRTSEYPPVASPKAFFTLVNSAFTRKRKMLRNSLQHLHSSESVQSALSSVGLPETSRPDELTLDQFVALHNALTANCSSSI
ncbi:unnamed protein product [Sphagnum jensenii]|uniref:rRNA adenine N(6)-methyltransferase n=1 Tax=Sphagnum jensenii TaxID=128206 RepID=A0ABP1BI32_9BRYO